MTVQTYLHVAIPGRPISLTTNIAPETLSLDGVSRVYMPNISDLKLPNRRLDPLGGGGNSSASMSVTFFTDELTPGGILQKGVPIQNSDVYAWAESGGRYLQIFIGAVNSISWSDDQLSLTIECSRKSSTLAQPFPPGRILDEGRFVRRKTFTITNPDPAVPSPSNRRTFPLLIPIDGIEFQSVLGTPSAPINHLSVDPANVVYLGTEVPFPGTNTTAQMPTAKIHFSDDQANFPIPIAYGDFPSNLPLTSCFNYKVSSENTKSGAFEYFRVYVFIVGNHNVIGDPFSVTTTDIGQQFTCRLFFKDIFFGIGFGFVSADGYGTPVAYMTCAVEYQTADYEEPSDGFLKGFNPNEAYVKNFQGKTKADGSLMTGLGDVLLDLWRSYGGAAADLVDWETVSSNTDELNQLEISILINDANNRQTLETIVRNRIGGQFPISVGYPRGKLAWQSTLIQKNRQAVRRLSYGVDLISRAAVGETSLDQVVNDLAVSFSISGTTAKNTESIKFDRANNEIARQSYDRWGVRPKKEISLSDCGDPSTAAAVGQRELILNGGVHLSVQYETFDLGLFESPFYSVFEIVDPTIGLNADRFFLVGVKWNTSQTALVIDFLSEKIV